MRGDGEAYLHYSRKEFSSNMANMDWPHHITILRAPALCKRASSVRTVPMTLPPPSLIARLESYERRKVSPEMLELRLRMAERRATHLVRALASSSLPCFAFPPTHRDILSCRLAAEALPVHDHRARCTSERPRGCRSRPRSLEKATRSSGSVRLTINGWR